MTALALNYGDAGTIRCDVARAMRPKALMRVSEAAAEYVRVRTPSGGVAPWDASLTPYMIEPMDLLNNRFAEAVIFAGPAQSGKTQALLDCWLGYVIVCEEADITLIQTTQDTARDYERRRLRRLHRNSPKIRAMLSSSRQDDNTFDKVYKSGSILSLGWPSISQLSGRSLRYIALTDYDRMPENIDNEGSPFDLAKMRTQTFLSRAMVLAESSPGHEVIDPKWRSDAKHPHQAPPARGILSLYNLGDRRRWYWPCPHCGEYFMQLPGVEGFGYEVDADLFGLVDPDSLTHVGVVCTRCGAHIEETHKPAMTRDGLWVPEGGRIEEGRVIPGEASAKRRIASFWLPGAAAAFATWRGILLEYLRALQQFQATGSEEALKKAVTQNLAEPYVPRKYQGKTDAKDLEARKEDVPKRQVPAGARFLVATVDVQAEKFVAQVEGFGVDFESWILDRFDIRWSRREDRGGPQPVDPAGHIEDWALITDQVVSARYPLADGSGRFMSIYHTACDSGGKAGVTQRAYDYWRSLRRRGLHRRFSLVKGERPRPGARQRIVTESFPDTTRRKGRNSGARGDVPVWLLNTTELKDAVSADLKRTEVGAGHVHFPDWLSNAFFDELAAEVRTDKGWEHVSGRNEALDLMAYARAVLHIMRAWTIDWSRPPAWAVPWNENNAAVSDEQHLEAERALSASDFKVC